MSILKSRDSRGTESADSGRRNFFWKLGAGVSTALASTAGLASTETADTDNLALKLALLEAEQQLRKFHQAYEGAMDKGAFDEVIGMFADDAEVVFDGKTFSHRGEGIARLYRERFRDGKIGKRMEPAPGFEPDAALQQETLDVLPDRLSAKARFPYSIQAGMPIESENSLASMARLQGEGVKTWWEGGVYDVRYVRDVVDAPWRMARLEYRTLSRADFRAGRSYATALTVQAAP